MQSISKEIARHLHDVHFGGNWTSVNVKDTLSGISWQEAVTKVHSFNTIAMLVFHMHYYVQAILQVVRGLPLDAHDNLSFNVSPIRSQEDWEILQSETISDAAALSMLIEQLPVEKLSENFTGEKYGSWYRNLHGVIEHTHYHLGQIVIIKKLLEER